ncbi:MAG: MutH/Sau3AI family endonuclease [Myxococcales bacterium]
MEPPRDEAELRQRLSRLAGRRLAEIAAEHGIAAAKGKGWAGTLLEKALGATGSSRAEPDFPHLGIELKTIPIDERGRPLESCFVASLEMARYDLRWETSAVRKKLLRVAWVPVEAVGQRRCGSALIWSPSAGEREALRGDYEDIVALLAEGARVTARTGTWLQLRPKGRDARHLRWALDEEGALSRTAPRAFYLRRTFTAALLQRFFAAPP